MAATGYTPIYLYYSSTTSNVPSASNLGYGELAINITDGNLFYKNNSNAVVTIPVLQSSGSQNGWLSSTDWTTFNNKAPSLTYTTNYIPYGQGTTTPALSANLQFDGTTLTTTGISTSNNITLTGTGNRITADFSNATITNRAALQSSTTNGNTIIYALPNGTATTGTFVAVNASNPTNGSYIQIAATSTDTRIYSSRYGTGTYYPIIFYTSNAEVLRITETSKYLRFVSTGGGIQFSGNTASANALNAYEEGSWTPTATATTGTITSYTSAGSYTRVGRLVTLFFNITITNNGTGAGSITIGGVPFNLSSTNCSGTISEYTAVGFQGMVYGLTATTLACFKYNLTYPGGTNNVLVGTINYYV